MQFKSCAIAIIRCATILMVCAPASAFAQSTKSGDSVTISATQLRPLEIEEAKAFPFKQQRVAIGQIAFNEDQSTVVVAPFSGRVTKITGKVGDVVKRGATLFEIDSPEVAQAQTDLISALHAGEKVRSQMNLAKRVFDRQTLLMSQRATSQREADQARADLSGAEVDLKNAAGGVLAARNKLRVLVGRSEGDIERIERDKTVNPLITVNAPIAGTIVARKIGPGQFVRTESGDALFSIADLSTMWLKAAVPENDIGNIRAGQIVEVKVGAFPDRTFKAEVTTIAAASDPVTHRVVVRSEIANPDGLLRPEMFATFKIFTGQGDSVIAVPDASVIREGELSFVYVQTKAVTFQRRRVVTGLEQDGKVEIREGLKPGEKVVWRGAIFVDNEWKQ